MKSGAILLCVLFLLAGRLQAHPVAQGSLELHVARGEAIATLRIANEQIFVASALGEGATAAADFEALLSAHSAYLLRHFTLLADGVPQPGEVRAVRPPTDRSVNGLTTYELRFALSGEPAQIEARQDFLTEILFSPGNPWEAPLVARVVVEGRTAVEGALLTARQPLRVALRTPVAPRHRLAWDFFREGVTHIVAGWDHALFVAALVLALPGFWRVLALVSVFTLAHTVTITLGVLGLVPLRASVVEPLIAASIVAAAALNLVRPGRGAFSARLAVAFGFGLVHGLGFAGGLGAAMEGYGPGALALAIGSFSAGVEIGHQFVVLPLLGVMALIRHWVPARLPLAVRGAGAAICAAGLWLLVSLLR